MDAAHIITEADWFGFSLLAGLAAMLLGFLLVRLS